MFRFESPLYPIADADSCADVVALAAAMLDGGARLIQLRAKAASTRELVGLGRAVRARSDAAGAQLIINDRVDVARLIGAAGVHLGQDDLPASAARAQLGPHAVIGVSTHNLAQLDAAVGEAVADYLAYGPIFETASKANPDPTQGLAALRAVRARCARPLVAIGGITLERVAEVRAAGADAVAVIAAIAGAADPAAATRALLAELLPLKKGGSATARRSPAGS
ncbi:MAG: thiamine phosphate synthase [Deltaproteobacteria bacterium]|nr:thiamine phosphate synthase [Deltaproteobacteria bacterium]